MSVKNHKVNIRALGRVSIESAATTVLMVDERPGSLLLICKSALVDSESIAVD